MSSRLAALLAPVVALFGAQASFAQHHGGGGHGGGHMGGHMGGMHMGGGGMHHVGGFGGRHIGGFGGGLGYGGFGYGLGGYGLGYGLGYPYGYGGLGGYGLGYGYGGNYGYGSYGYGGLAGMGMGSAYYPGYYSSGTGYPAFPTPTYTTPAYTAPVPAATAKPAEAVITLTVPDGAKVWINNKETPAPGGTVVYKSAVLQPGAQSTLNIKARWNDSTREMNLPITAGDKMGIDLRNQ